MVSVSGGLPLCPRACYRWPSPASEQCLSSAGCFSALGPPGPRPPTATRRAPPSTSEGAYGSETVPPPPDPASSGLATASRVQNTPFCTRLRPATASRVQNSPSCPRPRPATASRVQNGPSCPRPRPVTASRVQNSPSCPRPRPATASRVQNTPFCPRPRPAGEPGTDERWSEGRK